MTAPPADSARRLTRTRIRRLAVFVLVAAIEFGLFETGLRLWGSSEAAPAFQGLFENDGVVGYRLKPNARVRFTTAEFETDLAINAAGLRDDEEVGPKAPGERRILLLGDSLVLSVQVPFGETFGELLEADLNRRSKGTRYRVLNAGVQGYGPIEEQLLFQQIGRMLEPDLVITVVFVGNDAEEAVTSLRKLDPESRTGVARVSESLMTRLRRIVRRSMVLQILRLRILAATERFRNLTPPEPPIQSYAADPAPRIAEGMVITTRALETITAEAGSLGAQSAIVLMPARFQVDDADYGRLRDIVRDAGGELVRDAATDRFARALGTLPVPRLDVLPAMKRALPGPDLFYQRTVHLTPRGHRVVADALVKFVEEARLLAPRETETAH
jgi:lysophospholipase L1-like esterase